MVGGPDYLDENLPRLIASSGDLRNEREFADLTLDPQRTLEVAALHFARFRRRLLRTAKRNLERLDEVYDEYRIAAIEELETPELRADLRRRLDRFIARNQHRGDPDKLEAAMFYAMCLAPEQEVLQKPLPLGLFGLMTVIYEETINRAMAEIPDAEEIAGEELTDIWRLSHMKEDLTALAAATKRARTLDDLSRRIETEADLALAWRRQQPLLLETLEMELARWEPDFVPGYFTAEEVAQAMERMERERLSKPWHLSRYILPVALTHWFGIVQDLLAERITPERQAQIAAGLRASGQRVLKSKDPEKRALAPHFLAAADSVANENQPANNTILQSMFLISFSTALDNQDALSPQWRRFVQRLDNSHFVQELREENGS